MSGKNKKLVTAKRLGPIILAGMLDGDAGENINGPSIIRVPDWVPNRLGAYYCYFSHHDGSYIRLAFADDMGGPWTVHQPGILSLAACPLARGHIASPDVVVDHAARSIRLFFHAPAVERNGQQMTFLACSRDGLRFVPAGGDVGPSYARYFQHEGSHYLIMGTDRFRAYRSTDGMTGWEAGPIILAGHSGADLRMRHCAVLVRGSILWIFYTRKGDAPERILAGTLDLSDDWQNWCVDGDETLLAPEEIYEGVNEPVQPSTGGASKKAECALRDPAIFEDGGTIWMAYAYAGERGIALAELDFHPR